MLLIYNAEHMSSEFQDKLAEALIQLSRSKARRAFRVVLIINHATADILQDNLQYALPIKCRIPSYSERSLHEKEDFILRFFKKEQDELKCSIQISSSVFRIFLNSKLINGIMDLKSMIKNTCANAYAQRTEESAPCMIRLLDLPLELLQEEAGNLWEGKEHYYTLSDIRQYDDREHILSIFDELLDIFALCAQNEISFHQLLTQTRAAIWKYYDYLVFNDHYENMRFEKFSHFFNDVLHTILQENQLDLPQGCMFVLAQILLSETNKRSAIYLWIKERSDDPETGAADRSRCIRKSVKTCSDRAFLCDRHCRCRIAFHRCHDHALHGRASSHDKTPPFAEQRAVRLLAVCIGGVVSYV